jgi:hypothetical protein
MKKRVFLLKYGDYKTSNIISEIILDSRFLYIEKKKYLKL